MQNSNLRDTYTCFLAVREGEGLMNIKIRTAVTFLRRVHGSFKALANIPFLQLGCRYNFLKGYSFTKLAMIPL